MNFDAILDGVVTMGGVLGSFGGKMLEAVQCGFYIAWHGHFTGAFVVIPVAGYAAVKGCFPVNGDGFIVSSQKVEKVVYVVLAHILNSKVVDDEAKQDWSEGVAPKARSVTDLVIPVFGETGGQ